MSDTTTPHTPRNVALLSGLLLLGVIVSAALLGPLFVRDPLERTLITEIGGRLRGTPFPPFQSWQFPLGSDRFGRDLWARLLHGIQPTLTLVLLIGTVRLLIGLLIGVAAGWSRGGVGRLAGLLLQAAASVPVLITALAGITAVGIERGLVAFLVGMALTGWVDTAQQVRSATQRIAVLPYIEAARALGANDLQILIRHITRHLRPLLLMLFAAELSATMLLTAGLAFLGYYIGGGVWVILSGELIPVASRVAGPPELGQLLGTAPRLFSISPPWEMIFPATVMIGTTLSFALIAEGLRRRMARLRPAAGRFAGLLGRLEQRSVELAGRPRVLLGVRLLSIGLGAALLIPAVLPLLRGPALPAADAAQTALPPRDQPWQSERGDAAATRFVEQLPQQVTELLRIPLSVTPLGSPVIATDGTIALAGVEGRLLVLNADGSERFNHELAAAPAGAPALAADGTIYIATRDGGLNAFAPDGSQRWAFKSRYRAEASSGPVVGPDGTVYYGILDAVQAVNPDGSERWLAADRSLPFVELAPSVSPDGTLVFLRNRVFRSSDGARLVIEPVADEPVFAEPAFLVGVDGGLYYRSEHRMLPWRLEDNALTIDPSRGWPASSVFFYPRDAGVTAAGTAWWLYAASYADTRLVWADGGGTLLGDRLVALRDARLIAVDRDGTLLLCGSGAGPTCAVYDVGSGAAARWSVSFRGSGSVTGGAVTTDRVLLLLESGELVILVPAAP